MLYDGHLACRAPLWQHFGDVAWLPGWRFVLKGGAGLPSAGADSDLLQCAPLFAVGTLTNPFRHLPTACRAFVGFVFGLGHGATAFASNEGATDPTTFGAGCAGNVAKKLPQIRENGPGQSQ